MTEPKWLKDAIFYQVYPQSFYDSNGDGIGDIPGLIEKLDYIQWLGCNAIWMNPCFDSPFNDAGYDVRDFYKVAPRYGTNADLRRLFKQAHKRNMRVLLDLVPAHTSDEHRWFRESCKPQKNKYTHWYLWTDSAWSWQKEGFSLIRGASDRNGCYLPSFFASQPALNLGFARPDPKQPWQLPVDHPDVQAVRREIKNILRFWLDAGADGFRADMASSIVKNDPGWKETSRFWREVRTLLDQRYPEAALLSEWSTPSAAIAAGFHADFMIHINDTAYDALFRQEIWRNHWTRRNAPSFFDKQGKGDITAFLKPFLNYQAKIRRKGHICVPSGNHDISRLSYGRSGRELELAFAFLMTLPALPLVYYGDEIGMKYLRHLHSKEGGYERTGSRTPMQWTGGKNAGFSTAPKSKLYLPIDSAPGAPNVEKQSRQNNSLLNRVRQLIQLRRSAPALGRDGKLTLLCAEKGKYPLVYLRQAGRQRYLVVLNPSGQDQAATVPLTAKEKPKKRIGRGRIDFLPHGRRTNLIAGPSGYGIFQISEDT